MNKFKNYLINLKNSFLPIFFFYLRKTTLSATNMGSILFKKNRDPYENRINVTQVIKSVDLCLMLFDCMSVNV